MAFQLPDLPYSYDALAPYMSRETLEYHHDKHHLRYINTMNDMIKGTPLENADLDTIVKESFADPSKKGLFNQAGQTWNHNHFWPMMKPNGGGSIPGELEKKIVEDFGSVDAFKDAFAKAGATLFGSGWAWLAMDNGKLTVMQSPNGENPLAHGKHALLGVDVWEHAFYIDYRNDKAKYLDAFLNNLVNWEYVADLFSKAR